MKKSIIAIILTAIFTATAQDDGFKWQEASKEMDALPFSRKFIDSVKNAHLGANNPQSGLRKVPAGRFINGETLVFEGGWTIFNAGYMVISTQNIRSQNLLRISGKVMTNNVVSAIYKVRDHSISWVDPDGLYPVFFEQHSREGKKYRMDAYTVYDQKNKKLYVRKKKLEEFNVLPFTHDFLSIIFYARSLPLKPGETYEANMWSSPKAEPVRFKIHTKQEKVKTPAGTFDCLRVEPQMIGDGRVYNKKSKMEIWISNDEHRYPVRIKSSAKVGSINATLIQITK